MPRRNPTLRNVNFIAGFYSNEHPTPVTFDDPTFLATDGNFRKRMRLNVADKFAITLEQGDSLPCDNGPRRCGAPRCPAPNSPHWKRTQHALYPMRQPHRVPKRALYALRRTASEYRNSDPLHRIPVCREETSHSSRDPARMFRLFRSGP